MEAAPHGAASSFCASAVSSGRRPFGCGRSGGVPDGRPSCPEAAPVGVEDGDEPHFNSFLDSDRGIS